MATYVSVAELKSFLGIPVLDTSKDALLQIYLDSAEDTINRYLGVDTMASSDVTERIKECDLLRRYDGVRFFVRKRPVTAIKKIEGVTYSGTEGVDFIIENLRGIVIKNLTNYLIGIKFQTFEIIYTAGYTTIPGSIKMAEMILAASLSTNSGGNSAYQSYAIGEEKVVFRSQEEYLSVLNSLDQFKVYK